MRLKSASEVVRKDISHFQPCVHGGEVWDVAKESGLGVEDLVDFSSSVNPLGPSSRVFEAISSGYNRLTLYPDSGSNALREAIACHFGNINKNNIIVGNGSTELIYLFSEVFIDKDDVALIPSPTFGEYAKAVVRGGGKPKLVTPRQDFVIDPSLLMREMKDAKVVFLCNPNNPTSVMIRPNTLRDIVERALEEKIVVFVDEDFIEFVDDEKGNSLVNCLAKYPNLFVLRTFTKFYGLTGLRVGYGIADEETVRVLLKAKMPWNVNSLAQSAAVAALSDKEHSRQTKRVVEVEKRFLNNELAAIKGFKVFPADANFIFLDIRQSGFSASQLRERMINHGVLIRDCSSFEGLDAFFIRVAIRTRKENERLLEVFRKVVGNAT